MKEDIELTEEEIDYFEKIVRGIIYILTVIMGIFYIIGYEITVIVVGIICLLFISIGVLLSIVRKKADGLDMSVSDYMNKIIKDNK